VTAILSPALTGPLAIQHGDYRRARGGAARGQRGRGRPARDPGAGLALATKSCAVRCKRPRPRLQEILHLLANEWRSGIDRR